MIGDRFKPLLKGFFEWLKTILSEFKISIRDFKNKGFLKNTALHNLLHTFAIGKVCVPFSVSELGPFGLFYEWKQNIKKQWC